jgi:hypothetical protein
MGDPSPRFSDLFARFHSKAERAAILDHQNRSLLRGSREALARSRETLRRTQDYKRGDDRAPDGITRSPGDVGQERP